ncbi:MFS transporter [Nonomuraea jabiensis]|uniref:MFS transporter n=1 Tax=Nonomuraea jabiensis TaxID=882448 RepID=UPI003D73FE10
MLTSLAVGFDVTILNLALPSMAEDLHADNAQLRWFVTVYTLVLAAGMIPAGMAGDRFGHKRTLLVALVIVGVSSLVAAYAPSTGIFIAARAVLGLGAGLLMPTMLALIPTMFTATRSGRRRSERWRAPRCWPSPSARSWAAGC